MACKDAQLKLVQQHCLVTNRDHKQHDCIIAAFDLTDTAKRQIDVSDLPPSKRPGQWDEANYVQVRKRKAEEAAEAAAEVAAEGAAEAAAEEAAEEEAAATAEEVEATTTTEPGPTSSPRPTCVLAPNADCAGVDLSGADLAGMNPALIHS